MAGEIWQTTTRGPDGGALDLVECFTRLGLTIPGTNAIDVERVANMLESSKHEDKVTTDSVVEAVSVALANVTALINPEALVVAGPWSARGSLLPRLIHAMKTAAVPTEVRPTLIAGNSFLAGARINALDRARDRVLNAPPG